MVCEEESILIKKVKRWQRCWANEKARRIKSGGREEEKDWNWKKNASKEGKRFCHFLLILKSKVWSGLKTNIRIHLIQKLAYQH